MKAISLRQPYASLWVGGHKINETRAYRTRHRGWLLVHASTWSDFSMLSAELRQHLDHRFGGWEKRWSRGGIIGAVYLARMEPTGLAVQLASREEKLYGDFAPGRWAWRADMPIEFPSPIPYKGKLGLFDVDDAVVAAAHPVAFGAMAVA